MRDKNEMIEVKTMERPAISLKSLKVGIGIISVIMIIGIVLIFLRIDTPIESLLPVWLIVLVILIDDLKEKTKEKKEDIQKNE